MENKSFVTYEDFGAVGDGKTDDMDAVIAAHNYANINFLRVKTKPSAVYYIFGDGKTADIKTDTDWSESRFIVDDTAVTDRVKPVFTVSSALKPLNLDIQSFAVNQDKLDIRLQNNCVVIVTNSNRRHFFRYGLNQDSGHAQTDCIIADRSGYILSSVLWDFSDITSAAAYPIDPRRLTLSGGIFTTIANRGESKYNYFDRGIHIRRSNVAVEGIAHYIDGEGDEGSPYGGFLRASDCADISFTDCYFTGHKIYSTIGSAGKPVNMGTYDINIHRSQNIKFTRCREDNIMDRSLWGVFTSNYCKNMTVENCIFSRVDAHMNVENLTVKNTILGHQGLNVIGHGRLLIEGVTTYGNQPVEFRGDYGSRWFGDLVIRDTVWYPDIYSNKSPRIISQYNAGGHDFGYESCLPDTVTIDNFIVRDGMYTSDPAYCDVEIFGTNGMNRNVSDFDTNSEFPLIFTKKLLCRDMRTESGRGFKIWGQNPQDCWCRSPRSCGTNFTAKLDNVERSVNFGDYTAHLSDCTGDHRLKPKIEII
ncbi:MAG: hypothetical protein ACYCWE_17700 [Eubacteriales bacterium]